MSTSLLLVVVVAILYITQIQAQQPEFQFCYILKGACGQTCPKTGLFLGPSSLLCPLPSRCCIKRTPETPRAVPASKPAPIKPTSPACGVGMTNRVTSRIIGGDTAKRCEFPWVVHIPKSPCGGSIIDRRHILTAAHCFDYVKASDTVITIGEYSRQEWRPKAEFNTTRFRLFIHDSYDPRFYANDIAVIKLESPIDWDAYECMAPICMPSPYKRFRATKCTTAGWGVVRAKFNYLDPPFADTLKKVQVDILNDQLCRNEFPANYFGDNNYCAGVLAGGRDSCGGDSGGPLMCWENNRWYAAGVVSAGSGCAQVKKPAIYTDVAKYMKWIKIVMRAK